MEWYLRTVTSELAWQDRTSDANPSTIELVEHSKLSAALNWSVRCKWFSFRVALFWAGHCKWFSFHAALLVSHFTIASMVLNNKGEFAAAAVHSLLDNAWHAAAAASLWLLHFIRARLKKNEKYPHLSISLESRLSVSLLPSAFCQRHGRAPLDLSALSVSISPTRSTTSPPPGSAHLLSRPVHRRPPPPVSPNSPPPTSSAHHPLARL